MGWIDVTLKVIVAEAPRISLFRVDSLGENATLREGQ